MLNALFKALESVDLSQYSSVVFNVYEDDDAYTIEASYDDDSLVIGREHPFFICGTDTAWNKVEKNIGKSLAKYIKANKEKYQHYDSIAYGFVDGDLIYIQTPKNKKETVRFTSENLKRLNPAQLKAWLSVYLTSETKDSSWKEWFTLKFEDLSEEELDHWRGFLADNFDYEKYGKNG